MAACERVRENSVIKADIKPKIDINKLTELLH